MQDTFRVHTHVSLRNSQMSHFVSKSKAERIDRVALFRAIRAVRDRVKAQAERRRTQAEHERSLAYEASRRRSIDVEHELELRVRLWQKQADLDYKQSRRLPLRALLCLALSVYVFVQQFGRMPEAFTLF